MTFTGVAGYRPFSWRTDYPRWDWRIFGELTAERAGMFRWQNAPIAESARGRCSRTERWASTA